MGPFPKTSIPELAMHTSALYLVLCISMPAQASSEALRCKAPAELERRVQSHPSAASYDELGAYFGQVDQYSCAISAFRASLRLNPKSWQTHSHLGLALLASGEPVQAAQELRAS